MLEHFVRKSSVFLMDGVSIYMCFHGEYDGVVVCVVFWPER